MTAPSDQHRSDIGKRAVVDRWNTQEASMTVSHCDDLAHLYERKASEGLVDAKFLLRNGDETGTEEVCREVLNFYQAIEEGRTELLDFGDLRWKEVD